MSAKAVSEYDGKRILAKWLLSPPSGFQSSTASQKQSFSPSTKLARVSLDLEDTSAPYKPSADLKNDSSSAPVKVMAPEKHVIESILAKAFSELEKGEPWLLTDKLVVKPDQLIKRRGKLGLLGINLDWNGVKKWILERAGAPIQVDKVHGILKSFIIEPFVPHSQDTEHYVCIQSVRDGDLILFYDKGGIDVGDVDSKAKKFLVPTNQSITEFVQQLDTDLLSEIKSKDKKRVLVDFISRLFTVYIDLHFTYMEINPLVVLDPTPENPTPLVVYLDLAAKVDQTAEFESGKYWSQATTPTGLPLQQLFFPAPFGRELTKEEAYIAELDAKTGASLKLTILNPNGRIWTMVAGGGASVVYSDAIAAHGFSHELANYGEYSGAPSETQTYEYAKTILDLMTRGKSVPSDGKVLIIGGGIANFTNVAATFKGIVRALKEFQARLIQNKVSIFVRRGGPNYQEGLKLMRELGETLGVPIHVYGPETHITAIVPMALGLKNTTPSQTAAEMSATERMFYGQSMANASTASLDSLTSNSPKKEKDPVIIRHGQEDHIAHFPSTPVAEKPWYQPFTSQTRSFIYGMQPRAVQGMLDFDHMCKRKTPSVAAMIYPFGGSHVQKFYWGDKETLMPVVESIEDAVKKFPEVDTVVNFASFRSVYESTMELLKFNSIKTIAIIAEGVPERRSKQLIETAKKKGVLIIGPATVGGIKPGCFKIGNTGGMIDNIVSSKLYRAGSVAYVSKSGGMSNELNNLIARYTDGVYEGIAIGGDRYPGSTFIDHLLRFQDDPNCKILVLLGEVGGVEEYRVAEAIKSKRIIKPVISWCIGTCAGMFGAEVQFGHAGALANSNLETAEAKNKALSAAGAIVPKTFEDLPNVLLKTYQDLVKSGSIVPKPEPEMPKVPIDYSWAQELGLVRKPASFVSTICDDRGQELLYAGMPISKVFEENIGIGGVLSLLWFKRRLPAYACHFIEMILMLTADHGPAVSGAHNTIVTARAGKDLISSLVSGLLTIGDRFGGALDGAAEQFGKAYDEGLTPQEFVDNMRKSHKLILGIGHKIKSRNNPDLRVEILTNYAKKHFPQCPTLDFAREVEKITTAKKDNLILNVDGAVGVLFVDLLRYSGAFSHEEAEEYIKIGTLNGLFVLGRSIGFVGHYLDQKRLKQGLYRHPWDDISYLVGGAESVMVNAKDLNSSAFGSTSYTREEQEIITQRLHMRLGPEYVSYRQGPGGSRVCYLEGNKATELANKVFGFNGWSSSVVEMTVDYLDEVNGRFNVGISCVVRVTLKDGSFRENLGYGASASSRQKGEAFEKAKKEAVTDALKRCLKDFGNALGNCIYDKEYLKDLSKCRSMSRQGIDQSNIIRPGMEWDSYRKDLSMSKEDIETVIMEDEVAQPPAIDPNPKLVQSIGTNDNQAISTSRTSNIVGNPSHESEHVTLDSVVPGKSPVRNTNANLPPSKQIPRDNITSAFPLLTKTNHNDNVLLQQSGHTKVTSNSNNSKYLKNNNHNQPSKKINNNVILDSDNAMQTNLPRSTNTENTHGPIIRQNQQTINSAKNMNMVSSSMMKSLNEIPFDDIDESMVLSAMNDFDIPGFGPSGADSSSRNNYPVAIPYKRPAPQQTHNKVQNNMHAQKRQLF